MEIAQDEVDHNFEASETTSSSVSIIDAEPTATTAEAIQEGTILFLTEEGIYQPLTSKRPLTENNVSIASPAASDVLPSKRIRPDVQNFDLAQILQNSVTGKALVAIYDKYQEFEPKYQGYLCDLIVQHFLNQFPFE